MQCWKGKLDFNFSFSNIFLLLMGPCWSCEQPKLQQWRMTNRSSHWVSLLTNSAPRTPVGASASPLPRIVNVNCGTSGSITRALDGTLHSIDSSSTDMAGLLEHSLELSTHICYWRSCPCSLPHHFAPDAVSGLGISWQCVLGSWQVSFFLTGKPRTGNKKKQLYCSSLSKRKFRRERKY